MKNAAITFLWVIHLTALVGIALGYETFFLEKSPLTMLYLTVLVFFYYPIKQLKWILLFLGFFAIGISVEWLGVHTGILFGNYYYEDNFGPKIDGIPYLIGVNWALLTFVTHQLSIRMTNTPWIIAAIGAALMVFLDFFLEQICEYAGFWSFTDGAGWFNYLCWYIIAYALHLAATQLNLKGDFKISLHLYIVQLTFAIFLWIIISTI